MSKQSARAAAYASLTRLSLAAATRLSLVAAARLSLAAVLAACARPVDRTAQPSWRQPEPTAGTARRETRPAGAHTVEMAPAGPAAPVYNDGRPVPAPRSPLTEAIRREVERVAAELGVPAPATDGRLCAAAREMAEVTPPDAPLPYPFVEFAAQRNGMIEPPPHIVTVRGPTDETMVASLADRLRSILRSDQVTRLGVGVAERANGEGVTVLAFQSSFIETGPIPRRIDAEGRLLLEAALKPPYASPEVFVTREDGSVHELTVAATGPGFRAELACGRRRGRQQVEIIALGRSGSEIMANFPVWCGEDPPTAITVDLDAVEAAPVGSAEEAQQRLAELINRDRARHGLPRLAAWPRLTEVARAHSREMRDTGVVAHVSPTTGDAGDRVRAGRIRVSLVMENLASAATVEQAEEGLMNSPGHRSGILSPEATHMGVGVALGEVAGSPQLFVTQLFVRLPAPIDFRLAREQAVGAIERVRRLDEDRELSLVAQDLAQDMASGARAADIFGRARERMGAKRTPYSQVVAMVTTTADIAAFQPDKGVVDRSVAAYGLGVAQGDHDVVGEAAIHIVLLLGQR